MKTLMAYDIEVFPNFFYASFYDGTHRFGFEHDEMGALLDFINDNSLVLIGFNNFGYDDVVLKWLSDRPGATTREIYEFSKRIITKGRTDNGIFKIQYSKASWAYSVDIFQYFNKRGSLKEWQCKEQLDRVLESACDFDAPLPRSKWAETIVYCRNDVISTWYLFQKNKHLFEIRNSLMELYSLANRVHVVGEAGLAQMVFVAMHTARTGQWINIIRQNAAENEDNKAGEWEMCDIVSSKVEFSTDEFRYFFSSFMDTSVVATDSKRTKWKLSDAWKKPIALAGREFQLGVGGLHSVDAPAVFRESDVFKIVDLDVESYYPSLIIEEGLYPKQLGQSFTEDLRGLRDKRLKAKHTKSDDKKIQNEANQVNASLKIVINSTFGKLNDAYSPLRSVPDALRVTINGQLMLLMLIEELWFRGAEILSCNTDGVTVIWDQTSLKNKLPAIMKKWSRQTGHILELSEFATYARRDVNAYIVKKLDGKIKRKGAFTPFPDTGKWDGIVVKLAAEKFILDGVDPAKFIRSHKQPKDFLYYQRVKNGGTIQIGETHIGKIARWYVAKEGETVKRKNPDGSLDTVPHGYTAKIAMNIADWKDVGGPDDINYKYYIEEAHNLINSTKVQDVKKPRKSKKTPTLEEEEGD